MRCSTVLVMTALAASLAVCSGCRWSGCMKGPERTIHVPLDLPDFLMKRFSHGDLKEAMGAFREDVEWHGPGGVQPPSKGRREMQTHYEVMKIACSDAAMAPSKILAAGDAAFVLYAFRGTHDGWLSGVKGTGRPVGAEGLAFYRFDYLAIYEIVDYFNPNTLLVQAGLLPGEAAAVPSLPVEFETIRSGVVPPTEWKDRVEAAYQAMNRGDHAPFLQMMDPAVVHQDHLADTVTRGPGNVTRSITGFEGGYDDLRFHILGIHQVEQYVVVRLTWTGTHTGGQGRPWAKNKRPTGDRADLFHVRDDRVVRVQSFGNPLDLGLQLDFERF